MAYRFITLTNAVPGDEAGYQSWYLEQHLNDIVLIPGVLNGQFFTAVEPETARWRYIAVFEVDGDQVAGIFDAMGRQAGTPQMPLHPMHRESYFFLVGEPVGSQRGVAAQDANCKLLALSRPAEGREQDLVDWYETRHFDDMVRIPGVRNAQRFALRPSGRGNAAPWTLAALYDARANEPKELLQSIRARRGTADMQLTDALDTSVEVACLYKALSPRRASVG